MNLREVRQQDLRNPNSVREVAQKIAPGPSGRSWVPVPEWMSFRTALVGASGLSGRFLDSSAEVDVL